MNVTEATPSPSTICLKPDFSTFLPVKNVTNAPSAKSPKAHSNAPANICKLELPKKNGIMGIIAPIENKANDQSAAL